MRKIPLLALIFLPILLEGKTGSEDKMERKKKENGNKNESEGERVGRVGTENE